MQDSNIGSKLRDIRLARSLKQYEVAEALGLSRAAISNIENGRRSLTLHTLKRFADFYQIDINYFEIDNQKDEVIDLLERTRKIFESSAVPQNEKEELYLQVMKLYISTKEQL